MVCKSRPRQVHSSRAALMDTHAAGDLSLNQTAALQSVFVSPPLNGARWHAYLWVEGVARWVG